MHALTVTNGFILFIQFVVDHFRIKIKYEIHVSF